jgi:hypothetical protein
MAWRWQRLCGRYSNWSPTVTSVLQEEESYGSCEVNMTSLLCCFKTRGSCPFSFSFCAKNWIHKSHNHRSWPMQIKRFSEPVTGSDLVQTKHDDMVNFT